mgnify:CR=1 FL=1
MTATAVWARQGSSVPGKLTMGAEFSYFKYEELDLMEQAGPLFGVYAEYAMRTPENGKVSSSEGKWITMIKQILNPPQIFQWSAAVFSGS